VKRTLQKLKKDLDLLTVGERKELINHLKGHYSIFNEFADITSCPHCSSKDLAKNGKNQKGHQKYTCRGCKKHITFKTKRVLSGIHDVNAWNGFLEDFLNLNITPLRELKQKLGISEQTCHNWRHRLLSALESKEIKFKDESVEFDESWFLISNKGRQEMKITNQITYRHWRKSRVGDDPHYAKVLFAYGRTSRTLEVHKNHMGHTAKKDLEKYFIPGKVENITVISDKHKSYAAFFEENKIEHKSFVASHHRHWEDRSIHVQSVNAFTRDFKDFVNKRLHGVSTKYLGQYANWFMFLHDVKIQVDKKLAAGDKIRFNITDNICKTIVNDNVGLEKYRRLELNFQGFLKENGRTIHGRCRNHYYAKAA